MIKLSYSTRYNAGDLLNKDLVEKYSGDTLKQCKMYNADMIAIGGALYGLQYANSAKRRFLQKLLSLIYGKKPLYVWGSGFLHNTNNNKLYRNNLKVCALRGEKTKEKLYKLTGIKHNVPLADAGLLVDVLLEDGGKNIEKKYDIGLIPHLSQKDELHFKNMLQQDNVFYIDIERPAKEVAFDIASCHSIASSSLHGLIFADALHVPSLHVLGENILPGGNFKFEDYYSSFGLDDNTWNLSEKYPSKDNIISSYKINPELVEEKKKALIEVFPKI